MKRIPLHQKLNGVMLRALILCACVSVALIILQSTFYVSNAISSDSEYKYRLLTEHLQKANSLNRPNHDLAQLYNTLQEISFSSAISLVIQPNLTSSLATPSTQDSGGLTFSWQNGIVSQRPILYSDTCVKCHMDVASGQVAGQVNIQYKIADINVNLIASLIGTLVTLCFVMFFCYWVFRSFIQNQVEDAFDTLAHKINQISDHNDLHTDLSIESDIAEVKQIQDAFNKKNSRLKQAYEAVSTLSMTDSLTGLYNRNKLSQVLQEEINRRARYGTEFALVMMDLDGFKQINDMYGHEAGDKALITLSQLIKRRLRPTDTAVRLGGDEFMIVLSHVSPEQAQQFAQSLQAHINGYRVVYGQTSFVLSTSIGVAADNKLSSVEELLRISDQAMYSNKAARKEQLRARQR